MTSSSSRSRGCVANARASSSLRWSIVVRSRAGACCLAESPTKSIASPAFARATSSLRSRNNAPVITLARTVILPNGLATWNVRAKPCAQIVVRPQAHELATEGPHRAGIRPVITGDEIEARRLAGAVWSDQRDRLAFVDRKAQILNGAQSAEPPAEVANNECLSHRAEPLLRALGPAWTSLAAMSVKTPIRPAGRYRITAIRMRL